jgi:predicted amidohydrolase
MTEKKIHVAIGSTCSRPGDLPHNLAQIAEFSRRAGEDGADLLLTPEMSATGYGAYAEVLTLAEPAGDGPIYGALAKLADETSVVVCAGFVERATDEARHLSHYIVFPGGRFVVQPKHRLNRAERGLTPKTWPDEPGKRKERFAYFDVAGVKCGLAICADSSCMRPDDIFAADGVELMLHPTGAGGKRKDRVTTAELATDAGRETYLRVLEQVFFPRKAVESCIRHGRAMAAVNMNGYDGRDFWHVGHGCIVTPLGEVAGLFHGQPNLDLQRPMYAHAEIDVLQRPGRAGA